MTTVDLGRAFPVSHGDWTSGGGTGTGGAYERLSIVRHLGKTWISAIETTEEPLGGSADGDIMVEDTNEFVKPVVQPMGLQVALQAQQTAAQTALTNAQAEKIRSETTAQKVENLVGVGIDLAKKVAEVRKSKKDTEEVEQKIENLKKTAQETEESIKLIKANIDNKEVQTRIAQFEDDVNKVIKSSVWYENGKAHGWEETVIERYYGNFKKDMAVLSHDEKKMLFDKDILDKLSKDIGLIAQGKLDELRKPTQEIQLLMKK